jgi:hypothetical protein
MEQFHVFWFNFNLNTPFSLVSNTLIHVCYKEILYFSLTVHTWGMFKEEKIIILYLFVLFLSPAVLP